MSEQTQSEAILEDFLQTHGLWFEKVEEVSNEKAAYRPDYLVSIADDVKIIFDLKEIVEDPNFGVILDPSRPHIRSHSGVLGEHIRRRIHGSKKQIQYGADQGLPSILLVYNCIDRVFQDFGTSRMDFNAAMYGALTINVDRATMRSSEMFNGNGQSLQEQKNTSFSAVGHLATEAGNRR